MTTICFGEILWDILPTGRFAGGAPFNVAYHLQHLGVQTRVVSAVGRDAFGDELLAYVESRGVDAAGIARDHDLPTGTVRAQIGPTGEASYSIAAPVAWDAIAVSDATRTEAKTTRALVFGSLAQRSSANRQALDALFELLPRDAERVFDVNLRPPFDDLKIVARSAPRATVLKLNHEEAARLAGGEVGDSASDERHARLLAKRYGCATVCVTAGIRGAGLWQDGQWFWCDGEPVKVVDTVGAGDAFLAALLAARLRGEPPVVGLRAACRQGEWVASQKGATPAYPR